MKRFSFFLFLLFSSFLAVSQITLSGYVYERSSKEPLIGANVFIDNKFGSSTDVNGKYEINTQKKAKYKIEVSFVGYKTITKEIKLEKIYGLCISLSS